MEQYGMCNYLYSTGMRNLVHMRIVKHDYVLCVMFVGERKNCPHKIFKPYCRVRKENLTIGARDQPPYNFDQKSECV